MFGGRMAARLDLGSACWMLEGGGVKYQMITLVLLPRGRVQADASFPSLACFVWSFNHDSPHHVCSQT